MAFLIKRKYNGKIWYLSSHSSKGGKPNPAREWSTNSKDAVQFFVSQSQIERLIQERLSDIEDQVEAVKLNSTTMNSAYNHIKYPTPNPNYP